MSEALRPLASPKRISIALWIILVGTVAIVAGISAGYPTQLANYFLLLAAFVGFGFWIVQRPFDGYLMLCGSLFLLVCYAVNPDRYVNLFDLIIPILGLTVYFGKWRREANEEDAKLVGPEHEAIKKVYNNFARAGIIMYVMIGFQLIHLWFRVGTLPFITELYLLGRSLEGALMFPISIWLLRTEKRIHMAIGAAIVAGAAFAVVNIYNIYVNHWFRAGVTWVFNYPQWPTEAANEGGFTMMLLWILILAQHQLKHRFRTYPMLAVVLYMLFLTASRSSMIGLVIFAVLALRRIKWQYLLAGLLLIPPALKFVPSDFFERMTRTATMERGSFEVYTIMIRVFGYQSAWRGFLDNWLYGVGFMGCQFTSEKYNDLRLAHLGAENIFLETAVGMGVIGLAVLGYWWYQMLRVGWVVSKVSPKGTFGNIMGGFTIPYMLGITFISNTGASQIGAIGLGQLVLWTAITIRAGHLAVEQGRLAQLQAPQARAPAPIE